MALILQIFYIIRVVLGILVHLSILPAIDNLDVVDRLPDIPFQNYA